jgi:hypothetical protein
MFTQLWRALVAPLLALGLVLIASAQSLCAEQIDTEHLFGFTVGSDVGDKGETEAESETTARTGKGTGSYSAFTQDFEIKHTLTDSFRIAASAVFAHHDIGGMADFDDRNRGAFQGLSTEARYRVVARGQAPFGATISIAPHWGRIDDLTGERVENYGGTLALLLDRELIARKLYAAVNLIYDPEVTRVAATGPWIRQSTLGVSAAVAFAPRPGIFLGGELRGLELHDGLGIGGVAGRALFGGPTLYAKLDERWWLSLAYNIQLAGHLAERSSALDLTNFERHQARLRVGYNF